MDSRLALSALALGAFMVTNLAGATGPTPAARPAPDDAVVPIVYMIDLSSGAELVAREAGRRFVPASITKAMTLYVAFELIRQGTLDPDQSLPIRDDTFREWSGKGSTMYIPARTSVRVDDLLMGIANISANDGAMVLAEGVAGSAQAWTSLMNAEARKLGMRDSHFATPNGWADEGRTFTTARDLARLARALVERHPQLYARYIGKPGFTYNGISQFNHDPLSGRVLGADGIKTGFTGQAGHGFLGSAERGGRRLVLVVAGAPSQSARNLLARDLVEWGFTATRSRALFPADTEIGRAQVQGGDALRVPLVTGPLPVGATLPPHGAVPVRLTVRYHGPLAAPIAAGEQVAELEVAAAGMPASRVPLFAGASVAPAGPLDRLMNGLAGLLRW